MENNQSNQVVKSELAIALMQMMQENCPNVVRASTANILNTFNNSNDQAFIIEQALLKLESLQGVTYNKSTTFRCKYHYKQENEANLFNFFNEINKLEESRIVGHWVWVKKPNDIKQLKAIGFRAVTDKTSDHYGEFYINAYMLNFRWNSGKTMPQIVKQLHR